MPSPDWSLLINYLPVIGTCTFGLMCLALLIGWYYVQYSTPRPVHTPYTDPQAMLKLYDLHTQAEAEPELSADELQRWEAENVEFERWEQALQEKAKAKEARRRERAEQRARDKAQVEQEFPAWLIEFAQNYVPTDNYAGMVRFSQWLTAILTYCNQHLAGRMPIRPVHQAANDQVFGQAPTHECYGRVFFEELSKHLARHGLLIDGRGNQGRKIADDALLRLRVHHPVSSSKLT